VTTPLVVAVILAIGQEWKTSVQKRQVGNVKAKDDSDQKKEDSGQKEEQKATSRIGKHNEKKLPPSPSPPSLSLASDKDKIRSRSLDNSEKERGRDLYKRLEELERELVAIRQQLVTSNRELTDTDGEMSVITNTNTDASANTDADARNKNKNGNDKDCSVANSKKVLQNVRSEGVQSITEENVLSIEKIKEKEEKEQEKVDLPVYTNAQLMYIYYLRLNSLTFDDLTIYCKEKLISLSQLQLSDLTQLFNDFQNMAIKFSDDTDKLFDDTLQFIYNDINESYQSLISYENSVEVLVISEINEMHFFLLNSMGYKNIQDLISVDLGPEDSRPENKVLHDMPPDSSPNAKNVLSVSPSPHQQIVHENISEIKIADDEIQNAEKNIVEKKKTINFFWWIK
jgi:hypothetical protein